MLLRQRKINKLSPEEKAIHELFDNLPTDPNDRNPMALAHKYSMTDTATITQDEALHLLEGRKTP